MDVWISIKGIQHADGESSALELSTAGQLERLSDGYSLTYEESETTGMQGITTTMTVKPSLVTLERRGKMHSLMVLEKGRRTMCNYETGYGSLMMGVYARDIRSSLTDQGGNLDLHYTLDINSSMASANEVHITVKQAGLSNPLN